MSDSPPAPMNANPVGWGWQLLAWIAAVMLSWWGFDGWFADWPTDLALATLGWLLLGPVVWFLTSGRHREGEAPAEPRIAPTSRSTPGSPRASPSHSVQNITRQDLIASVIIGGIAFGLSVATAWPQWSLPPAYHDEYSYLFQAETLLAGRFGWPSAASHPELFDQMHVLNEGRMASRYYPGTGAWIAPWLAMGMPYLGHWIAGALSAVLVYWIGRELSDRWVGWVAAITFAAAPGPALFSNLLLAHHPTMLALLVFTLWFLRGVQRGGLMNWLIAGGGLAAAMLCRPATAAGFALPFGLVALTRLARASWKESRPMLFGLGMPLVIGFGVMLTYNHEITGRWLTSPYQVYTDTYTPRHVFGLNNVVRGEQHLGPKVLESYDTWAENLTPGKAWWNVLNRLISTAMFTIDTPLMLVTLLLGMILWPRMPTGWKLVSASIVTLHAMHWPYWYVGIFGWHYVYESAPAWCLLLAYVGRSLQQSWPVPQRNLLTGWAAGFVMLPWLGMYVDAGEAWTARWKKGIGVIAFARRQHAVFQQTLQRDVKELPALVLIDGPHDGQQLDYVINHAGLTAPVLLGRYRDHQTDWNDIAAAFPERHLYHYHLNEQRAVPVKAITRPTKTVR